MKKLLVSLCVYFCCSAIVSAKTDVSLQKTRGGYLFEFDLPKYDLVMVNTLGLQVGDVSGADLYYSIRGSDFFSNSLETLGRPQIPAITFFMAVAGPADIPSFEVVTSVEEVRVLPRHILPAQKPWPKNQPASERTFDIDAGYYRSAGVRGPVAQVSEAFQVRGVYAVRVDILPFLYNPLEKKLTVIKNMTLKINTALNAKYTTMDSKEMQNHLKYLLVNYKDAVNEVPDRILNDLYLIITPAKFESALAQFVSFRQKRFTVKLVTTATAGTNAAAIETFIRNHSPKPTFVLLVGDVADVPGKSSTSYTDHYYACPASGSTPDKFVGRFSATNETELANMIKKTIAQETNMAAIPQKAVLTGGKDAGSGSIAEGTHNYVINTYLSKDGYACTKLYTNSDNSATEDKWKAAVNGGVTWNIYSGHGGQTSWAVGAWSVNAADINALSNTIYPFSYAFACYTGDYEGTCVSESWIRAEKGAVTHLGSVLTSNWGGDDDLERAMFDGIYSTTNPQTTIGASMCAGKKACTKTYNEQYNLMGDPACNAFPVQTGPYIGVTFPNGGQELEQGTTQTILWSDNIDGNVKIELLKAGSVAEVLAATTPSDGNFDWKVPVSSGTDYKIKITSVDSTALFDQSDQNFSIISEYILTCPYVQTFDTLDTGKLILPKKWEQSAADDFDWMVWKNKTPTKEADQGAATGPNADNTSGSGKYIYVESSSSPFNGNPGKKVDFMTPKFFLKNANNPKLHFWYHMFSNNQGVDEMGELHLDICVDGTWKSDVFTVSKNQGDKWIEKIVDLNPYKGDRVIFRFRAITGTGWASDICIDDFKVLSEGNDIHATINRPAAFDLNYVQSGIRFQVPESAGTNRVTVLLYNVHGRAVRTLVDCALAAGAYSIPLDNVAAGLYVVSMKAHGYARTMSIVVAR